MPRQTWSRRAAAGRVMVILSICLALRLIGGAAIDAGEVRFHRIPNSAGLSHNSIYAMIQDREGFMWFGTADGLDRFDGHEFVVYDTDPSTRGSLKNPVIRSLCEDRDGFIWVGTEGGIFRLDVASRTFEPLALNVDETVSAKNVLAIFEDRFGRLWVGTDRGAFLYSEEERRFDHVTPGGGVDPSVSRDVLAFDEDSEGTVWALVQEGDTAFLERVAPTNEIRLRIGREWGYVAGFAFDREGRLWLKPPYPVRVDTGSGVISAPDGVLAERQTLSVREARDGTIWFGLDGSFCHADRHHEAICRAIVPDGNWLQNIGNVVFEDRSGAVWIGTFGGPRRWDPLAKPFEIWRHDRADSSSLSADAISSIWVDEEGIVWVGTFGGGLNRFDRETGRATRFRHVPGDGATIPHDVIWALHGDDHGGLWLGTEAGVARFDRRTKKSELVDLPVPRRNTIGRFNAIEADDRGTLWIAGPLGLYRFDPDTGRAKFFMPPHEDGLSTTSIESILPRSDGIWLGTGVLGLRSFDPVTESFTDYPFETAEGTKLRSEGLWSLHESRDGAIWIGSGVGLSRFDPEAEAFMHFFQKDGLPGSIVYSVDGDEEGRLWLGTNRGLVRFAPAVAGRGRFRTFDVSDGIAGMEFNRNAVYRSADGELFFGGLEGLTVFDPSEIHDDPRPPPVALTAIEVLGRKGVRNIDPRGLETLELDWDDDPFGFEFVALSFANPERNRYRYRLVGFDREWVAAGARRFARYTNVPPGDYVFRVAGSNQDGAWNEVGASLPVTIAPPWWMTFWFRALLVLIVAGILWMIHHARVSQLVEIERLRLRIASDLHDDLSSELSGISVTAELLRRDAKVDPGMRAKLALLRDKAVAMASMMRDTAWSIHPEHDTMGAMIRRMRTTAATLLGDVDLSFDAADLPSERAIRMTSRRNVFLVFKELVNNVSKHAEASRVSIALERVDGVFRITVEDDGAGFDPGKATDGDGLRNVRRRVEEMGGRFEIESEPGSGAKATVDLPLE